MVASLLIEIMNADSEEAGSSLRTIYSSDNQRDESIDALLRAIDKLTDENGYKIVSEYIDRAKMGTNDRREELQRMIRDSDDGDFEVVIVHKLDRFSRKRYDSAIYRKALEENGVKSEAVAVMAGRNGFRLRKVDDAHQRMQRLHAARFVVLEDVVVFDHRAHMLK